MFVKSGISTFDFNPPSNATFVIKNTTTNKRTKLKIATIIFVLGCSSKNFFFLGFFEVSSPTAFIILVYAPSLFSTITKSPSGSFNALLKSANISVADWYLSVGSFFIAFKTISFTAVGISGFSSIGVTGSSCICFNATETGVSASKGTFPVSISYITTPNEYKSDFASITLPFACSGEK